MASGHVNRTKRPNTWLHRPMLQPNQGCADHSRGGLSRHRGGQPLDRHRPRLAEVHLPARASSPSEPGPSAPLLLVVSQSIAVIVLGLVWFVFFRTYGRTRTQFIAQGLRALWQSSKEGKSERVPR